MAQTEVDSVSIDSRDLENALIQSKEKSMQITSHLVEEDGVYGELILLGYVLFIFPSFVSLLFLVIIMMFALAGTMALSIQAGLLIM